MTPGRLAALVVVVTSLVGARASAAPCPAEIEQWVDRCTKASGLEVRGTECFGALMTLDLATTAGPLRVEVARGTERSFRRAGVLGLAPVGEFADWNAEPPALRTALDRVLACASADTGLGESLRDDHRPEVGPERARGHGAGAAPGIAHANGSRPRTLLPPGWLWIVALATAAFGCVAYLRRHPILPGSRWTALAVVATGALAALVRLVTGPVAFLHQNGQGPLWVAAALGQTHGGWPYGEGYRELFSLAARAVPSAPETGVFVLQGALGATSIVCAWIIARCASGKRVIAWAMAVAVALDPGLSRLSQSESYYGATTSLLFLAAALLSVVAERWGRSRRQALPLLVAAALLVAQAARVHPVCWAAALLLPLVVACRPGARRLALGLSALSAVTIGAAVLLSSGAELVGVLRSSLGEQWIGVAGDRLGWSLRLAVPFALGGVALAVQRARLARAAGVLLVAATLCWATNLVSGHAPWVDGAAWRLFAPVFVAGGASLLTAVPRARRLAPWTATAVLVMGALVAARDRARFVRLPTDVLEAEWARAWRHEVPEGHLVLYVERVGRRVCTLPLYPAPSAQRQVLALSSGGEAELRTVRGEFTYYRSSLCGTTEGRGACERVEAMLDLRQIAERELPAIPSMTGLDYEGRSVMVALFRATRRQ